MWRARLCAALGRARPRPLESGFVSPDGLIWFDDRGPMSAAMWRATAMLREGKHREALVAFRKLQDAAPLDARASRGATHAAWRHLEEALRLDPGLLAARFALAAARKRAGGSGP